MEWDYLTTTIGHNYFLKIMKLIILFALFVFVSKVIVIM